MQLENLQVDEPAAAATDEPANPVPDGTEAAPQGADSAPAATPGDSPARKDPVQDRIDEITRKRRDAERRADALERELIALKSQGRPAPKDDRPAAQLKTLADFEYDEGKFYEYLRTVNLEESRKFLREELKREREKETADRRISTFKQRERDFAKQNTDYFDKTYDRSLPFTDVMTEVITESDEGPAIAYYLANNTDIAEKLSQLSPYAMAREIGRIEATLVADRKKPPVVTSNAPPPVPKIEGSADAALPKSLDDPNMSDAEWNKLRRKQLAAKRK